FIGDIFGHAGRRIVADHVADIRSSQSIDVVIANCENSAAGFGVTPNVADEMLAALPADVKVRFIDFHAEVTSEKMAFGWYLDGRVSAVIGTHTHIPTADTRVLPNGTAYQTDCGMTGPY